VGSLCHASKKEGDPRQEKARAYVGDGVSPSGRTQDIARVKTPGGVVKKS